MLAAPLALSFVGSFHAAWPPGLQPNTQVIDAQPRIHPAYATLSRPSDDTYRRLDALIEQDSRKYKPHFLRLLASSASQLIPSLDLKRSLNSALKPDITAEIPSPTIPTRLSDTFFNSDKNTRTAILAQITAITDATPISFKLMLPKTQMTDVVVILPGFAEKSDLSPFKAMVDALLQQGYGVVITRLRDQGPWGQRGHLRNALQLLFDLKVLVEKVKLLFPNLGCCIVGHSTGGLGVTASKVFGLIDANIPSICINPWFGLRKRAAPSPELVQLGRSLYDAGIRRFPFRWGDKAITCASYLQMEDLIIQLKSEIAQKTDLEKDALANDMVFFQSRLDPLVDPKSVDTIAHTLGSSVEKTTGTHSPHHAEGNQKRQKDAIAFIEQLTTTIQNTLTAHK